eukprot:1896801-Ditylum_brightwellii.AAC.1
MIKDYFIKNRSASISYDSLRDFYHCHLQNRRNHVQSWGHDCYYWNMKLRNDCHTFYFDSGLGLVAIGVDALLFAVLDTFLQP